MSVFGLFWVLLSTIVYLNREKLFSLRSTSLILSSREEAISEAERSGKSGIIFFIIPSSCKVCEPEEDILQETNRLGWVFLQIKEGSQDYEGILTDDRFSEFYPALEASQLIWGGMNLGEEILFLEAGMPKKESLERKLGRKTLEAK